MERYMEQKKDMYMVFIDMGKTYEKVSRGHLEGLVKAVSTKYVTPIMGRFFWLLHLPCTIA
jgi:hypothetical protein